MWSRHMAFRGLALLVLGVVLPIVGTAAAETTPGGLPAGVTPTHYAIALDVDPAAPTFRGATRIDVTVAAPTDRVVLNAKELTIGRAVVVGRESDPARVVVDEKAETATLLFDRPLPAGRSTLAIDYDGKVSESAAGLFVTPYQTPQGTARMLTTQFEAADARRVFPGWDEPAVKATFDLTATIPAGLVAVSNMPVAATTPAGSGKQRVTFATTPRMSTYLLFLGVGDLESITTDVGGTRVAVVAKRGDAEKGRFALQAAAGLLRYYNDYFGTPFPLPKLDLLAVPGAGGFSAMENWGAILYFEPALLLDPTASSEADRQRVFVVVAHEMAHQWFGDLVTMRWWDDLWLNEGFASWMENKATDRFHPEWSIWLQAKSARDRAMRSDALCTTHAIVQPIETPAQADQAFDEITYQKGQAVIRMLEAYLGPDTFRDGIRRYMRAHAYGNTVTGDLWEQLAAASGKKVADVAASFTRQPGVPLVAAEPGACKGSRRTIELRQQRFALDDPNPPPLSWQVPVGLRTVGTPAATAEILLDGAATVPLGSCGEEAAVTANADGIGYYRVAYAPALFAALTRRFADLSPADALTVLSDSWALSEAGRAPVGNYLTLTRKIAADADYAVWRQVFDTLSYLDELYEGAPGRAAFQAYARSVLAPVAARLGWDAKPGEPANDAILRQQILTLLGLLGEPMVVAEVQRRFGMFRNDPASLEGPTRLVVLRVAAARADASAYDALHTAARQTTSFLQKQQIYEALTYARDPALAGRTLAFSLSDELPTQLRPLLLRGVAANGRHPDLAWTFMVEHFDAVTASLDSLGRYRLPPSIAANFADAARARELEEFAADHIPEDARADTHRAAAVIELRAKVRSERLPEIDRWLAEGGGAANVQ
ncbi:M1 family metallopeptidase [Benzoatithermus flavus]|uniref:Aminopeptidase n=1 Tax=Benzoatithermus flavus TaxID=3108223 RepID=A0ABU8XNX6_9PROT